MSDATLDLQEPNIEPPPLTPPQSVTLEEIKEAGQWIPRVKAEMRRVLIGQDHLVDRLLLALLTHGHILLEGVPGLAKTLAIKTLAGCLHASFKRFQFTPDLLPADLLGTMVYHPKDGEFTPKLGPIFANLILADEINRAPAKVQSALLEAMQERQVTLGDQTWKLPDPFLVLATQNPIDQEGTYQLPEAQLDRFLVKVKVDYPTPEEELTVLNLMSTSSPKLEIQAVAGTEEVAKARAVVNRIFIDDQIKHYIVRLIHATRFPDQVDPSLKSLIRCGASPRGTINLALAARAQAFLHDRDYVIPQDIKDLALDILRHRVLLSYEAEAEGITSEEVILRLLNRIPIP